MPPHHVQLPCSLTPGGSHAELLPLWHSCSSAAGRHVVMTYRPHFYAFVSHPPSRQWGRTSRHCSSCSNSTAALRRQHPTLTPERRCQQLLPLRPPSQPSANVDDEPCNTALSACLNPRETPNPGAD
eukprot:354906-Chlamydomonas_euryale.AAC.2